MTAETTQEQQPSNKPSIATGAPRPGTPTAASLQATSPGKYRVIRRNRQLTPFDESKIRVAITKAYLEIEGGTAAASSRIHDVVDDLTRQTVHALTRSHPESGTFHIEDIQDHVELALMRGGHHKVARKYVLYREERARERAEKEALEQSSDDQANTPLQVKATDGSLHPLDMERLQKLAEEACKDIEDVAPGPVFDETCRNLYDSVPESEIDRQLALSTRILIEKEPNYTFVAARLLLHSLRQEALNFVYDSTVQTHTLEMTVDYADYFPRYIRRGIGLELLSPHLAQEYDLEKLAAAIVPERDMQFTYLGLQTLYDRYFIHSNGTRFEMPQAFFMRVAMGLADPESGSGSPDHRVLQPAVDLRLHELHADPVQLRHPAPATVLVLPDYRARRPRRHFQFHQGRCHAVEIRRRPGQRLDPGSRHGLAYQGHQRTLPRGGAVSEGGQRHRRRRQSGRQTQGRHVRLSRNLAPGHRGVLGSSQEHRRRPAPHTPT